MMRLVIQKDGTVGVSNVFAQGLDLSQCGLPENFWALQWEERGINRGHIEYDSPLIDNTEITELPSWANACIAVWQAEIDRQEAEADEINRLATEAAQQAQEGK
jgi:hypothetical protein